MQKLYLKFKSGPGAWLVMGLVAVFALYGNWQSIDNNMMSTGLFLIWLITATYFAGQILTRIFAVPRWIVYGLGIFLSIFIFGFIANIFSSWFILNNLTIVISLALVLVALYCWSHFFLRQDISIQSDLIDRPIFQFKNIWLGVMAVLAILGWVIIYSARTGNYLSSPWQVISPWFVVIIFALAILMYLLVFSKRSNVVIVISIIVFSFLIHSYFLVYQEGFGGDRWRHIGSENRIMRGLEYQPTLLTSDIWYSQIGGVNVPRALIDTAKISYGFEWSLVVTASKISGINVVRVDQFLGLILLSLFLPLVMYAVAMALWPQRQFALLSALIPTAFHAIQYYSSQTLPAGLSFIFLIFIVGLWSANLKNSTKTSTLFILFLTVLMYFSYSLGFFLAVLMAILYGLFKLKNRFKYALIVFLPAIFIMEWLSFDSKFDGHFSVRIFYNSLMRQSNFIYNGVGRFLPFDVPYSHWISQLLALSVMAVLLFFIWWIFTLKNVSLKYFASGLILILINYILSWNLLSGLHIISRRLDIFAAIFMAMLLAWGLAYNLAGKKMVVVVAIVMSVLTITTYASGPILNASVTTNETLAMKYVWQEISNRPADFCVLANTWPLLALEAYSGKEVVAGNFPSDYNHQQPERVEIFDVIRKNPSRHILDRALRVTGKKECFLVIEDGAPEVTRDIKSMLGEPKVFGNNLVWRFGK